MKIKCKFTRETLFEYGTDSIKICLEKAVEMEVDLENADLENADLANAQLRCATLKNANLQSANLEGADLSGAYLPHTNFEDANLEGTNLYGANLRGVNFKGARLNDVPTIEDIHKKLYEAVIQEGNKLEMAIWHTSATTRSNAGWIIKLAGEEGENLESRIGTSAAAAVIYWKSDPNLEKIPDFYTNNEKAMEDIKKLAGISA